MTKIQKAIDDIRRNLEAAGYDVRRVTIEASEETRDGERGIEVRITLHDED